MTYTAVQLGYARTIVDVGRQLGVSPRGIEIGLSTALVETGLWNYANAKVPGSLGLPHDRVGSDGMSVGLFQQQVRQGNGGAWWWGPVEACQDPASSARMFFTALARLDYDGPNSPGSYAQAVQRSAFPDRYDERMGDAIALYNEITGGGGVPDYGITRTMHGYRVDTPANATGNSNGPRWRTDYVVIHTQEGGSSAENLANYLNSHNVSYNLVVDDAETIEVVPVGEGPWAAAEANNVGVHICVAGSFAAWSRDQWVACTPSLQRAAKAAAAACEQFGVPAERVRPGNGWPATHGIAAHGDFGVRGGGHTDPGPNFPWDIFIDMVHGTTTEEDALTPEQDAMLRRVHHELTERFQSRVRDDNGELSPYRDTMAGYALQTDAAAYRTELATAEILDRLDQIDARVRKLEGK